LIGTILLFNLVYNAFPESWLSRNLFMNTDHSLVMDAKHEVER
jgi:hypothetical protein